MKKKVLIIGFVILVGAVLLSGPTVQAAGAVTSSGTCSSNSMGDVTGIVNWASCFLFKTIVPFLFALATAAFIFGVITYYINPLNEEKKKKGKEFITGGLIALFLMVSMWGIVAIFTDTFEIDNVVPQLPGE